MAKKTEFFERHLYSEWTTKISHVIRAYLAAWTAIWMLYYGSSGIHKKFVHKSFTSDNLKFSNVQLNTTLGVASTRTSWLWCKINSFERDVSNSKFRINFSIKNSAFLSNKNITEELRICCMLALLQRTHFLITSKLQLWFHEQPLLVDQTLHDYVLRGWNLFKMFHTYGAYFSINIWFFYT